MLWKWVGGLSELFLTMGELTVLVKWAVSFLLPVFADLGFEFLL